MTNHGERIQQKNSSTRNLENKKNDWIPEIFFVSEIPKNIWTMMNIGVNILLEDESYF